MVTTRNLDIAQELSEFLQWFREVCIGKKFMASLQSYPSFDFQNFNVHTFDTLIEICNCLLGYHETVKIIVTTSDPDLELLIKLTWG